MSENGPIETPNSQTEPSTEGESTLQVAQTCLKAVEGYCKSERRSSNKVYATRDLIVSLTTSMPEHSKPEFNDSLGTYLSMLKQHDWSVRDAGGSQAPENPEMEEDTPVRGKRAASLGSPDGIRKKHKQDNLDFPWIIREQLSDVHLEGSLGKTLRLLKIFVRDLKFAKSSVINSSQAPLFPHSEWTNVIAGVLLQM